MIPEIKVAPLVSHWARFEETPKNAVKFGIIFPVTVVDIEVVNAAASSVIKIPVLCIFDIPFLLFSALLSMDIVSFLLMKNFISVGSLLSICWGNRI